MLQAESDAAKRDEDNDGIPDNRDALPHLDDHANFDSDGVPNGADHSPYERGWS